MSKKYKGKPQKKVTVYYDECRTCMGDSVIGPPEVHYKGEIYTLVDLENAREVEKLLKALGIVVEMINDCDDIVEF